MRKFIEDCKRIEECMGEDEKERPRMRKLTFMLLIFYNLIKIKKNKF